MQRIGILGCTGSIGTSAIDVISRFSDRFSISCLSTHSNIGLLSRQIRKFRPKAVCIVDRERSSQCRRRWPRVRVYEGEEGLQRMLI